MSSAPGTILPSAHAKGLGATQRRDGWWVGPLLTAVVLLFFVAYATVVAFIPNHYWVNGTNYLSPFFSPEIWGNSPHRLVEATRPSFLPGFIPFTAALVILMFPAGFRLTCYYYRKAYYRSIWLDPMACAVGEPRNSYWGEKTLPLSLWNFHRYFLYAAIVFVFILLYDGIISFWYPVNADGTTFRYALDASGAILPGQKPHHYAFGIGLGSIILLLNPIFIAGYTFGCHSLRHLVGGHADCFSESNGLKYRLWSFVSKLNAHHPFWAMLSLAWVLLADMYVRASSAWGWQHWITF